MVNRRMAKGIMVMNTWLYRMVDTGKFSDDFGKISFHKIGK